MPLVVERVEKVRQDSLASADKQAHALAERPTQFRDTNNPEHLSSLSYHPSGEDTFRLDI